MLLLGAWLWTLHTKQLFQNCYQLDLLSLVTDERLKKIIWQP